MPGFTVAVREKGKIGSWLYVDDSLKVTDTATRCKPLTRGEAENAKRMFVEGAAKLGRPIVAKIVRLVKREG